MTVRTRALAQHCSACRAGPANPPTAPTLASPYQPIESCSDHRASSDNHPRHLHGFPSKIAFAGALKSDKVQDGCNTRDARGPRPMKCLFGLITRLTTFAPEPPQQLGSPNFAAWN